MRWWPLLLGLVTCQPPPPPCPEPLVCQSEQHLVFNGKYTMPRSVKMCYCRGQFVSKDTLYPIIQ